MTGAMIRRILRLLLRHRNAKKPRVQITMTLNGWTSRIT